MIQDRLAARARAAADGVDVDELTRDLLDRVRIPSVTGREEDIAADAVGRLEALGLEVEVFHPHPALFREDPDWPGEETERELLPVVIGRAGREGGRRLILSGHLDVVPPGDRGAWTADPWAGAAYSTSPPASVAEPL